MVTKEKRQSLIRLVYEQRKITKEAAYVLEINYKTAFTIATSYETSGIIER